MLVAFLLSLAGCGLVIDFDPTGKDGGERRDAGMDAAWDAGMDAASDAGVDTPNDAPGSDGGDASVSVDATVEADGCVPGVLDVCNMFDDDCDGEVDEDDLPRSCWTDRDGDGATDLPVVRFCDPVCPSGYGPNPGSDCYDSATDPVAALVFPRQPAFFDAPHTRASGMMSFDYDCDGVPEQEYPTRGDCDRVGELCSLRSGFELPVPPCGASGLFFECSDACGVCMQSNATRIQRCH